LKSAVSTFKELNLIPELLHAVEVEMKFERPSKIQGSSIPVMMRGQNIIAQAQSGTGKTAAFCLGMLSRIDPNVQAPQAICVSPTRELAMQTYGVLQKLCKYYKNVEPFLLIPDITIPREIKNQVIVGTPGKFEFVLYKGRHMNPNMIKIFVLDEADQLFVADQKGQIAANKIIAKLPSKSNGPKKVVTSQMCFFSATYSDEIQRFIETCVPEPRTSIYIPPNRLSIDKLFQYYVKCQGDDARFTVLDSIYQRITNGQSIIFVETRKQAKLVFERMRSAQHEVSVIHGGDMDTKERDEVMLKFRKGENRILISTNLLSRGIDVLSVALVVNFDLPTQVGSQHCEADCETYLHRVGRSARFGQVGVAINLVYDQSSMNVLNQIKQHFFPDEPTRIAELRDDKNDPSITIDNSLQQINEKLESFAT